MSDAKVQIEVTSSFDGAGAQAAIAAQKQLTDESERYQATLKRMAEAQEEVNRTARLGDLRERLQASASEKGSADFAAQLASQRKAAAASTRELGTSEAALAQQLEDSLDPAVARDKGNLEQLVKAKGNWSQSIALLTRQVPGFGAVTAALKGPFGVAGVAIGAAAIVVRHAIQQYRELLALNRELLKEASGTGFARFEDENRDAMRASAVAAAAYEISLRKLLASRTELERAQSREDAAAKDRASAASAADKALIESRTAEAKAKFKGDELPLARALLEIEQQSAALSKQRAEEESQLELQRLTRQKRAAEAELAAARRSLETVGPTAATADEAARMGKADIAHLRETDASARESMKRNQTAVDEILTAFGSGREMAPDVKANVISQAATGSVAGVMKAVLPAGLMSISDANKLVLLAQAIKGNETTIAATPGLLRTAERSQFTKEVTAESAKGDLTAAQGRARSAAERAHTLGLTLNERQDDVTASRTPDLKQRRMETMFTAAEGADAIQAGLPATDDQKHAIAAVAKTDQFRGKSNATIIAMLAQINDTEADFAAALKHLEGQIKATAKRAANLR